MKVWKNCMFCIKTVFSHAPWNVLFSLLCFLIPTFFTGLQVLLVQRIVDRAVGYAKGQVPVDQVVLWGVLFVAMLTLWVSLQRIGFYEMAVTATKLTEKMAPEIADRLAQLEYAAFEEQATQEMFQKMSGEPETIIYNCYVNIVMAAQTIITLIFSMAVIFSISPWIGLGVVLIGVPMLVLGYYTAGRQVTVTEELADARRRMDDLKGLLTNKNAMYEMKLFGAEELLVGKWNYYSARQAEISIRENRKVTLADMGSRILNVVYLIFVVGTVAVGLLQGNLTLGQFTGALNGVSGIEGKLNMCSRQLAGMLNYAMQIDFYVKFMHLKIRSDLGRTAVLDHYDIAFENVSFRYPGTEREVLKNVTFYVKEGESIAFAGENGAGKSTIIKLLCGLYEPDTGSVTVGGVPVRELSPKLRTQVVSAVFQDFQEYQMTLRENVALGNLEALADDRKLLEALAHADAEALCGQEKGIELNLGKLNEDGVDLSKGQWQRVAMARAFVSDAKYLVLDEPTASLDPVAESHMYENFARIFKERGIIMISHRLASAKMADRILVLDGGRIVQTGSHEELMEAQGLYRTMYLTQSAFYQENNTASGQISGCGADGNLAVGIDAGRMELKMKEVHS